jgi:hypothetical protein
LIDLPRHTKSILADPMCVLLKLWELLGMA